MTIFNLKALEDPIGYYSNGYSFNFCKRFNITDEKTGKSQLTYVYKRSEDWSSDSPQGTPYTKDKYPEATESVDETDTEPRHLSITYKSDSICDNGLISDTYWKTNVEIFCNPEGSMKTELQSFDFNVTANRDTCVMKIQGRHKAGCPVVEATSFINWLAKNPIIAGIILISLGIIANFFGGYLFNWVITVTGGISIFFVVILLLSVFGGLKAMDSQAYSGHFGYILLAILCFTLAIASGVGIGYLTFRFKRLGAGLFGFFIGFICGFYLHKILIAWITENQFVKLVVIASAAIATGIYSFNWSKTLTVPTTAIIGSYLIIRGFSMFLGGFPYEGLGVSSDDDTPFHMENSYIYYTIAFILLLCGGVTFQRYKKYHMIYDDDQFAIMTSINKDDDYMRMDMMH